MAWIGTLTSEEYDITNPENLKAVAAKHLDEGEKVLAIGHPKEPQSMFSMNVWMLEMTMRHK